MYIIGTKVRYDEGKALRVLQKHGVDMEDMLIAPPSL